MARATEWIAPILASTALTAILFMAASPSWLPAQELPPPPTWAGDMADLVDRALAWLLRAAAWLSGHSD